MKNLLFIPCYRCAPQIVRVLEKIEPFQKYFSEIIIVDNISPDQTAETAKAFIIERNLAIKVLINPENAGLGGTHKLVFDYACENNFDHVVILHGDDQGDLKDFESILEIMSSQKLESFWMGARFHPLSKLTGYARFRIFGNLVYNALASILMTKTIYDFGGSGVNLFPVDSLRKHPYRGYSNDLTFHVYLLINAIKLGQPLHFHPVSWREDDQISNVKLAQQSIKLLKILRQAYRPQLISDAHVSLAASYKNWKQV